MTLFLYALLSIVFSFLCSIWEAVLLSITPSYVNSQLQAGTATGKKLDEFKTDIDRPLSAILTLNTIAHTVGAIGVGSAAGAMYGTKSIDVLGLSLSYESIIAALMTLAILFLSEIIPKTIGASNWKKLAPSTVTAIGFLIFILTPFIWLSQLITKRFKGHQVKSVFSRADILAMTSASEESGTLKSNESTVIKNLLQLDDLTAQDVMTPRSVIVMADENMNLKSFQDKHLPIRFSRVPVYSDQTDHISGFVLKDEILQSLLDGNGDITLKEIKRDIPMIKNSTSLTKIFDVFAKEKSHISVIVDNYGSLVGVLTMEDLLETILGFEITDETDSIEDLQAYARRKWEERAKDQGIIE